MIQSIPVITVDGPSGTGKSTVCHVLAAKLDWHLLDSGALYRTLAYAALLRDIQCDNAVELSTLAQVLNICFKSPGVNSEVKVILDGDDISDKLRTEKCGHIASRIAIIPEVRAALLDYQRTFLKLPGLIADGRDMGTVVFPAAPVKIYLLADAKRRAERRYKQLKKKGIDVNLRQLLLDITDRDARDKQRKIAPLKPADDALVIDTTDLNIVEVVESILTKARSAFSNLTESA